MSCHSLGGKPSVRQHTHDKRSHVERRTAQILASLALPLLFTFSPVKPRPATHDTAEELFHPLKPLRARIAKAPLPPPHPSILCQFASSSCLSLFMSWLPLPSNPLQSLQSLSRSDRLIVFLPLSYGALCEEGVSACPVHAIKHAVHTDLSGPSHVHHLL